MASNRRNHRCLLDRPVGRNMYSTMRLLRDLLLLQLLLLPELLLRLLLRREEGQAAQTPRPVRSSAGGAAPRLPSSSADDGRRPTWTARAAAIRTVRSREEWTRCGAKGERGCAAADAELGYGVEETRRR